MYRLDFIYYVRYCIWLIDRLNFEVGNGLRLLKEVKEYSFLLVFCYCCGLIMKLIIFV